MTRREFLGLAPALLATVPGSAATTPVPAGRPVVIAHRGAHTRTHENSLSAIEAAIEAGVDYVELDVRRTRDGTPVLLHDGTLDRTTTGTGRLADLDLPAFRRLQLRDRDRPGLAPEPPPTLSEAIEKLRNRIGLYLDFKDGDRAVVARMIREAGMAARTVVYDDLPHVAAWREAAPDLPLMVSPRPADLQAAELGQLRSRYPVEILDGGADAYTPEIVRAVQARGYQVWIDIQKPDEDESWWRRMLALGANGLQSDHPSALLAFLRREGAR